MRSPKRKEWLDFILLNYGVELNDGEITVRAKQADFPQKKHNLICAISEISDLEITAKHIVSSLFREDVKRLLDEAKYHIHTKFYHQRQHRNRIHF